MLIAALGGADSRLRKVILLPYSALMRPQFECCALFWHPSTREMEVQERVQLNGHEGTGASLLWSRQSSGGISFNFYKYLKGDGKRLEPDSFQWFPVIGPEETGTNWNMGESLWTAGNTFFSCEGNWALAQVALGCNRISITGDIQKSSRYGPRQSSLDCLAWELDQMTSRSLFWLHLFSNSVKVMEWIFFRLNNPTKHPMALRMWPNHHMYTTASFLDTICF